MFAHRRRSVLLRVQTASSMHCAGRAVRFFPPRTAHDSTLGWNAGRNRRTDHERQGVLSNAICNVAFETRSGRAKRSSAAHVAASGSMRYALNRWPSRTPGSAARDPASSTTLCSSTAAAMTNVCPTCVGRRADALHWTTDQSARSGTARSLAAGCQGQAGAVAALEAGSEAPRLRRLPRLGRRRAQSGQHVSCSLARFLEQKAGAAAQLDAH